MDKKKKQDKEQSKNHSAPFTNTKVTSSIFDRFLSNFQIQAFLLSIICFGFYTNTFKNGYALDDFLIIENNAAINKGVSGIPKLFTSDIFEDYYQKYNANNRLTGGRYRPLSLITFALEQEIWGKKILSSNSGVNKSNTRLVYVRHVNNVLLYILSVVILLYFIRRVIFPNQPLVAFLSVFIFAIHPIHTEVVANIKSRDEILSLLFVTLTFIQAYHYAEFGKLKNLALGSAFFFLALLSKEYAVGLIVLVPLMFYLFNKQSAFKAIKNTLPYLATLVMYLFIRHTFVPISSGTEDNELLNNPYLLATGTEKIATQIATLFRYFKLLVFPHPLSADYSYAQIPYSSFTDPIVWISIIFHLLLMGAFVFFLNKKLPLVFAIAMYLIWLSLVSNLIFNIGATMGERLIYHSSLGFSMALAYFIHEAHQKVKADGMATLGLLGLMLVLLVASGSKTKARNKDWESNSTLFRKDVLTAENSAVTNGNAGAAYLELVPSQSNEQQRKEALNKALNYLDKAILIHPGYTLAYINRGNVYFQLGNLQNAKRDWDTAKQQYPTHKDLPGLFASYYINTAVNTFGSKGEYYNAIEALNQGSTYEPNNTILLFNLGYYYNMVGKKDSAIISFQRIIDINPNDSLAIKCASFIEILKKSETKRNTQTLSTMP